MTAPSFAPIRLSPHSLQGPPLATSDPRRAERTSSESAQIRQVVACLDGSELGRGVVPHAQLISNAFGARLTLLRVLEADTRAAAFSTPTDPLDWGIREREARAHLEDVASKLAVLDQEIRSELIQGQPAEQICCWVENHQVDLTVLCSHGSRGRTDWDLASTARKLIDRIPGSLLLIPAEVAAAHHEVRYQRLLVPLDGSSRAESVVPLAMRIAASQGAEILLVHVVENPEIFRHGLPDAEGADLERRVADHNQRVSSEYLDRLRTRVNRTGVRVRSVVVRDGSVRTRLQQVVRDEKIDLVVMSAHGSAGRLDSPCGSVTEHALTHAVVPLLVLRDRVCRCRPKHRADDANPRRLKRPDPPDPTVT